MILKILLILLGVLLVLVIDVWLGRAFSGDSIPEGPEIQPPAPPVEGPYAVAITYVNVRSGPSTEYPSFGVAPPGSTAQILSSSEDGEWWWVSIPTSISPDGTGWVSTEYVTTHNTDQLPVPEP